MYSKAIAGEIVRLGVYIGGGLVGASIVQNLDKF